MRWKLELAAGEETLQSLEEPTGQSGGAAAPFGPLGIAAGGRKSDQPCLPADDAKGGEAEEKKASGTEPPTPNR